MNDRKQWLEDMGASEDDVLWDSDGREYIIDVLDMEPNEPGGIQERKVYLPEELQS